MPLTLANVGCGEKERRCSAGLLSLIALLGAVSCTETVPLGSWDGLASGGGSAAGEGGQGNLSCTRTGTPGAVNTGTSEVGATLTTTDWTWPSRSDVMEVDLTIEEEPLSDGYFWSYQFNFVSSSVAFGGFMGLQANGVFQHPDTAITDYDNRLAVFWIAGPVVDSQLADIQSPLALKYTASRFNTNWLAINAIYPWQVCRAYRLRVARQSLDSNGDIWYGAWVTDTVTSVRTQIGRILVPAAWGQLSTASSSWCDRIGWAQPATCSAVQHVSATWGFPSASTTSGSAFAPSGRNDHFGSTASPLKCPSSRFTGFSDAVRHESGVPL